MSLFQNIKIYSFVIFLELVRVKVAGQINLEQLTFLPRNSFVQFLSTFLPVFQSVATFFTSFAQSLIFFFSLISCEVTLYCISHLNSFLSFS